MVTPISVAKHYPGQAAAQASFVCTEGRAVVNRLVVAAYASGLDTIPSQVKVVPRLQFAVLA